MPWRAFGDSEPDCYLQPLLPQDVGFNALAGVRGFGVVVSQVLLLMTNLRFNALAGVRGFGANPYFAASSMLACWVSMPWRAFGDSEGHDAATDATSIDRFQCPGGRSGIRSNVPLERTITGVLVSMPWRAFGDSEDKAAAAFERRDGRFQCPGGRSGIRSLAWR